jgi:hypothetical protein
MLQTYERSCMGNSVGKEKVLVIWVGFEYRAWTFEFPPRDEGPWCWPLIGAFLIPSVLSVVADVRALAELPGWERKSPALARASCSTKEHVRNSLHA